MKYKGIRIGVSIINSRKCKRHSWYRVFDMATGKYLDCCDRCDATRRSKR